MALKAASHFNLQQSFEVFMKFILKLEGTDHRNEHRLGELYDKLSAKSRKHVDSAYKRAMESIGPGADDGRGVLLRRGARRLDPLQRRLRP